ncbi:hypothetical protein, partial [Plasmodium yoelii yoelii]
YITICMRRSNIKS